MNTLPSFILKLIECFHTLGNARIILNKRLERGRSINSTGCWNWIEGIGTTGYGKFKLCGITWNVHQVAGFVYFGFDPEKPMTLHKSECLNRACFNPDHLYLGTWSDNNKQAYRDGKVSGFTLHNMRNKVVNITLRRGR